MPTSNNPYDLINALETRYNELMEEQEDLVASTNITASDDGYIVTPNNQSGYKTINVHSEISNVQETVMFEGTDLDLVISYYWCNNDELHPFPHGPNRVYEDTIHASTVKIVDRTYTSTIGGDMSFDVETWDLYIDGVKQSYDIDGYELEGNTLYVDAIVGWG